MLNSNKSVMLNIPEVSHAEVGSAFSKRLAQTLIFTPEGQ